MVAFSITIFPAMTCTLHWQVVNNDVPIEKLVEKVTIPNANSLYSRREFSLSTTHGDKASKCGIREGKDFDL